MPSVSEDTGTGTIHPSVPLRYNPEHQCQCCSPLRVSRNLRLVPVGFPNRPRVPKPPQGPSPLACSLQGHSWGSKEPSQGLTLAPAAPGPCVSPRASPAGRGSLLSLLQVTDRGTQDSRGHQPASPCSDGSPQQLQASCMSFLWGFVTHDVSHLGFDQLVGMVVLFLCQAVAFLPPAVSGLTAIVCFF